jgi:hypothetical protein
MKQKAVATALSLSMLTLGACGSSTSDHAVSGGAIGAGVGAPWAVLSSAALRSRAQ